MTASRLPFEMLAPWWLVALTLLPFVWWAFRRSLVSLSRGAKFGLLTMRVLVVVCLILAATQVSFLTSSSDVHPVFVIDDSESVGESGRVAADEFVRNATEERGKDSFAIVRLSSLPAERTESHLQNAVEAAVFLAPAGTVAHPILLTDGLETEGQLSAVANHPISTVVLPRGNQPEVAVTELRGPESVDSGETVRLVANVPATLSGTYELDLFANEIRVETRTIQVEAGQNEVPFEALVEERMTFTSTVRPSVNGEGVADTNFENNSASVVVDVAGPTQILLIDRNPDELVDLQTALEQQQIETDVLPPAGWPSDIATLQKYDAVILSNVAASESSPQKMQLLKTWVRDFGGGVMMLGGESSFGLGGYRSTPVEDILPVRCDFQEKEEEPGLAMMMVLDKSDSMTGLKIESARQAAAASVELLTERDQVGVVAFDGSPFWVSDLVSASQQAQVIDRIAGIQPGGGTNLFPALQEAFGRLRSASSKLKHVLVLTDGYSVPGDFEGIVQEMAALRITVSTIGLGAADNELLAQLAEIGRGRHYKCDDPSELPQIFARETMSVNQPAIKEDPVLIDQVRTMPALTAIDFQQAPFLLGYVLTTPRPTSEVVLVESESRDPILCWWKFGLGTVVAFTSDATSRWGAEWQLWDGYGQFWSQLVRFIRPPIRDGELSVSVQRNGSRVSVLVEQPLSNGSTDDEIVVVLTTPSREVFTQKAEAVAAGLSKIEIDSSETGTFGYVVRRQSKSGQVMSRQAGTVTVTAATEDVVSPANEELLKAVAESSGGKFNPSPQDVFQPIAGHSVTSSRPLKTWLLLMAMLLYVCDVVARRVIVSRTG